MKTDVDLKLIHDGRHWVVSNDEFTVSGDTFDSLDRNLGEALKKSGKFSEGEQVNIFMGFDFDTIPTWLRQYHNHYFNRLLTLEL